jgi:hypothetical protein
LKLQTITIESEVSRSYAFQTARERVSAVLQLTEEEGRNKESIAKAHSIASEFFFDLVARKAEEHLAMLVEEKEG